LANTIDVLKFQKKKREPEEEKIKTDFKQKIGRITVSAVKSDSEWP
jgi:hypothetical protein